MFWGPTWEVSAESRRFMYQALRNIMTQIELREMLAELAPKMFMPLKLREISV